jgi:hypothetical protein
LVHGFPPLYSKQQPELASARFILFVFNTRLIARQRFDACLNQSVPEKEKGEKKMKRTLMQLFLAFGAVCSNGLLLHAESYRMAADVPFSYHAGSNMIPAGKTAVDHSGSASYQSLATPKGKTIFIAAQTGTTANKSACLIFHRYGSEYFLSEIWSPSGTGSKLQPSREERNMKERASTNDTATIAILASVAP